MKTGLIWFRCLVVVWALVQIGMVIASTAPLIEMGATKAVLPAIGAVIVGAIAGVFAVLYPVELLYRTYENLMKAPYLSKGKNN